MAQRDRDVLSATRRDAVAVVLSLLRRAVCAALAIAILVTTARPARAESVHLARSAVEATPGRFAPAASSQDDAVRRRGAEIDGAVAEALDDMGLEVVPLEQNVAADGELPAAARGTWAVAPRFELRAGGALLRIVAVRPGSRVLLVREEDLEGTELGALSVRAVVMVRDIVEAGRGQGGERPKKTAHASRVHEPPPAPPSAGLPILALNSALYGGYFGYALQRASGSPDSRLAYPMVALGAGLGLGASLLVADEWNIGEGDAWYLAAGIYWPGASGFLLAESYGKTPDERYAYGLLGATAGLGLGTVALATGRMSEGGAVLTHSGGAFGMLFGAMTQIAIDGSSDVTPTRGMGFGTGAGVVAAGVVATQVDITASRMLLLDLSVSLGWLGGAALASPLLFVEDADETHLRLFLGAVAAGAVAGGAIGWYATDKVGSRTTTLRVLPYAVLTPSPTGGSSEVGVVGAF